MNCFVTVVSADKFQHYIPLYIYAIKTMNIPVFIAVRGEIDSATNKAIKFLGDFQCCGISNMVEDGAAGAEHWKRYPNTVSATNTLRFLHDFVGTETFEHVLITDVDLMLFEDPFPWHVEQMARNGKPFAGHHGPWHKPHRPEIAPAWTGDFERVAGGFFCVKPAIWYPATEKHRGIAQRMLQAGHIGGFRESDEVTLARIIKDSGFKVPENKEFPSNLRGVHLGDFKDTMAHRWMNMEKMQKKLTDENCRRFIQADADPLFHRILGCLEGDKDLMQIIENVRIHIGQRKTV